MPRLSVIIPAFDHLDQVAACLRTVRETTDPALTEVLIQDDASPTYNGPLVFGSICERNSPNLGFAGNCNAGAKRAAGDVLLFLNQDIVIPADQAGWDAVLLALFDNEPRAGIVGPTLLFPNGAVQSVGGSFDAACQPYHIALGYANPDWEPINRPRVVGWVTGAALAIRRGLWNTLGGFDRIYGRGYFEDVDLCVMAQYHAGVQVWHEPRIRFTHHVGSTGGNPAFIKNALEFKRRWVDTRVITPDVQSIKVRFWA